ncbi:MAG: formylglycine-generating enzyme family protein [Planctomycetota bacterium]
MFKVVKMVKGLFGPQFLFCAGMIGALLSCSEKAPPRGKDDAPKVVKTTSGVEMVLLPGGWFTMGSSEKDQADETVHKVYVGPFCIDRFEVTQEEYERVMKENPSRWKQEKGPVEQIRWAQAVAYCNARSRAEGFQPAYDLKTWNCDFSASGYRLPTEAEWEYAARAGAQTRYFFGDSFSDLKEYAWYTENCHTQPRPVGQKRPNPWGLHDIYGNVWEWCNDFYKEDYYQESPAENPTGPTSGQHRVLRGGSWGSRPQQCRSSYRLDEDPGYTDVCFGADTHGFVGFRCVRACPKPASPETERP